MKLPFFKLELVSDGIDGSGVRVVATVERAHRLVAAAVALRAIAELARDARPLLRAFDIDDDDAASLAPAEPVTITLPETGIVH